MLLKILKTVKWAIPNQPSAPQLFLQEGEVKEVEDSIANDLVSLGYAKKSDKKEVEIKIDESAKVVVSEKKSISEYENKAVIPTSNKKRGRPKGRKGK